MKHVGLVLLILLLSGCGGKGAKDIWAEPFTNLKIPFNPEKVLYVKNLGTAQISGLVALASESGPLLGDYARIKLVPVAEYSEAVMDFLFEGDKAYFLGRQIDNLDRRYEQFMRHAVSDHEGKYTFFGVPAGKYFVYGAMANPDKKVYYGVRERVTVVDGKKVCVRGTFQLPTNLNLEFGLAL